MRLSPPAAGEAGSDDEGVAQDDAEEPTEKGPRIGRSWLRRKKKPAADTNETDDSSNNSSERSDQSQRAAGQPDKIDSEDIDWNSLSKAERRRLRKQLKRQNRAA
jgi:hypothetical protein